MRASCAGVARTGSAFSSRTSVLIASSPTGIASSLPALRLTGVASTALSLAGVASLLPTFSLTGIASLLTALGLTGVASLVAGIAGPDAGITRTRVALRPASVATGTEARIATACTGETRLTITSPASTTLGKAGRAYCPWLLWLEGHFAATAAQPDVEIEIISSGSCFVRARDSLSGGNLCVFLNEDLCAAETPERRYIRWKLLAVNDVFFSNLDARAHVESEVEQPVAIFRAAP